MAKRQIIPYEGTIIAKKTDCMPTNVFRNRNENHVLRNTSEEWDAHFPIFIVRGRQLEAVQRFLECNNEVSSQLEFAPLGYGFPKQM
jgi:hypothetical protein